MSISGERKEVLEKLGRIVNEILKRKTKTKESFFCHCCGERLKCAYVDRAGNVACFECIRSLKGNIFAQVMEEEE